MKHLSLSLLLISFILVFTQCKKDDPKPGPVKYDLVEIQTDFGNMVIWLYDQTPLHKDNFLKLTNDKFYDSLLFHRVVPGFVIQGGDPLGNGTGGPGYMINAEFNDSLTHVYGAVAAARLPDGQNPQKSSSGSQFYIVINKAGTHTLDKNYTVFGLVLSGMAAADAIAVVDRDSKTDKPINNVYMKKVSVVKYTEEELKTLYNFKIPTFN